MSRVIAEGPDWTFPLLERCHAALGGIAAGYRLDTYPSQIEIITTEQMLTACASVGMPLGYHHWSFGKRFVAAEQEYRRGRSGLAYEIVINSDPCIAYLLEENTLAMQVLVMAHACFGHNAFFKGNGLFRDWTDAAAILDELAWARDAIARCEERHGEEAVELWLDSCHALMNYGVDRYRRPAPRAPEAERRRHQAREAYRQSQVNELWRMLPRRDRATAGEARFPAEPQENLLGFIEAHAPHMQDWQRQIIGIVRRLAAYFHPQRQTQVMNEGWATFWHYTLLNDLYDQGRVNDGFMLEFLQSHTAVVHQLPFDSPHYGGLNPYTLGFAMMSDIRRICQQPTAEDRHWFPDLAGADWTRALDFAMRHFRDESFIAQYLSPKVMRDLRLFAVLDDDQQPHLEVSAIHDEQGYRRLRQALAEHYALASREPDIQVYSVDQRGDRSLTLRHTRSRRRPLDASAAEVLRHVHRLWGMPVRLETAHEDGRVELVGECSGKAEAGLGLA